MNILEVFESSWEVGRLIQMQRNEISQPRIWVPNTISGDGKNGFTILCEKTGVFLLIISSMWWDLAALKANPLVGCINRIMSKSHKTIISVDSSSTGQETADYSVVTYIKNHRQLRGNRPGWRGLGASLRRELFGQQCSQRAVALHQLKPLPFNRKPGWFRQRGSHES